MTEKRRLGRGLDALLGGPGGPFNGNAAEPAEAAGFRNVPITAVEENPYQPRQDFDPDELAALKESIKSHGLLQPIVVRSTGHGYQLVAGERRLRAAREAGWTDIPVRLVDFNDQQVFEAAIVENLHRSDLNAIEKARGFQDYIQRFRVTQDQLAQRLGIDRTTVSNLMRLLELPPTIQDAIRAGQISGSHAKAILSVDDPLQQESLCREIIAKGMSVRDAERQAKQMANHQPGTRRSAKEPPERTKHVAAIEDELRQRLAAKVEIRLRSAEKGQVVLHFESNDDFERIVEMLRGR